jgi:hypothetical protein
MKIKGLMGMWLVLGLTGIMSGCGHHTDNAPAVNAPSGRVVQGPVIDASIFADNVSDGIRFNLDNGEVFTKTDHDTGDFTLPSVPGYNYILVSKGGNDKLTGLPAIQMLAPSGSANVTPLTTLVALAPSQAAADKIKATILAMGNSYDSDISLSATPAVLNLVKSVETVVSSLTSAIQTAAGSATISPSQVSVIQAQTMQAIALTISNLPAASSAATLATPSSLTSTMVISINAAAVNIVAANANITAIPPSTASAIATASVDAASNAILGVSGTSTIEGNKTTPIVESTKINTGTKLTNTVITAPLVTAAISAAPIAAVKTPDVYTPPPIQVVTPINVPPAAGSQTIGNITFSPATLIYGGGTTTAAADATSNLPVTFTSTTPNVCTVSGKTITGIKAGMCILAADQAGNSSFSAASQVKTSILVDKATQAIGSISFSPATLKVGGTTTASASVTPSGLGVTFTSTTPNVCTVSGSTVTGVAAGTCTIAANQAGDENYKAADQQTSTITVGKTDQSITVTKNAPAGAANGSTFTVAATASSSLPVTYSSGSTSVCTNNGATFTMKAASGTCIVNYDQSGNATYNPAPQITNSTTASAVVVPPQNQTIGAIAFNPVTLNVNGTTTVSASATSGLAVAFTSTTPNVCNVSGSTVAAVTTGTCTIAANQGGNADFNAAPQVTGNIAVGKAGQSITVTKTAPLSLAFIANSTFTVAATASSNLLVTYSSGDTSVCTNSGATFTVIKPGTCVVQFDQSGTVNYAAAKQVTNNTPIGKLPQSISLVTFGTLGSNTIPVIAVATSELTVTFTSTTPDICAVSGSTVGAVAAGTCTIKADQAGNDFYGAADSKFGSITVNPIKPTGATGGTGGSTGGTGVGF